jgi:hypothetical protein
MDGYDEEEMTFGSCAGSQRMKLGTDIIDSRILEPRNSAKTTPATTVK